jgi:hypothetical protein
MFRATSQLTTRFRARGLPETPTPAGPSTAPLSRQPDPVASSPLTWLGQGLLAAFQTTPKRSRRRG